jgi:hypothetical protein
MDPDLVEVDDDIPGSVERRDESLQGAVGNPVPEVGEVLQKVDDGGLGHQAVVGHDDDGGAGKGVLEGPGGHEARVEAGAGDLGIFGYGVLREGVGEGDTHQASAVDADEERMFSGLETFGDEDVGGDIMIVDCFVGCCDDVEEGEFLLDLFNMELHCGYGNMFGDLIMEGIQRGIVTYFI